MKEDLGATGNDKQPKGTGEFRKLLAEPGLDYMPSVVRSVITHEEDRPNDN